MLETIRAMIQAQQNKPDFDTFYLNYMMHIQDLNINDEISYMLRKNSLDASNLSFIIEEDYKKLVDI